MTLIHKSCSLYLKGCTDRGGHLNNNVFMINCDCLKTSRGFLLPVQREALRWQLRRDEVLREGDFREPGNQLEINPSAFYFRWCSVTLTPLVNYLGVWVLSCLTNCISQEICSWIYYRQKVVWCLVAAF